MNTMLALLAMLVPDSSADPIKELVMKFLLSYGGIAGGVSFLVEGLKNMFKTWVPGRENVLVIVLTFLLGSAAKALGFGVYGPNTVNSWGQHELILIFVSVGAAAFHDKFLSVLTGYLQKASARAQTPPPPADTTPPTTTLKPDPDGTNTKGGNS